MISIELYLLLRQNIKVIKNLGRKHGYYCYLLLNAIGALILGIDAFIGKQWGFVLLEGVWSIVAIHGLFKYFNKKEVK